MYEGDVWKKWSKNLAEASLRKENMCNCAKHEPKSWGVGVTWKFIFCPFPRDFFKSLFGSNVVKCFMIPLLATGVCDLWKWQIYIPMNEYREK